MAQPYKGLSFSFNKKANPGAPAYTIASRSAQAGQFSARLPQLPLPWQAGRWLQHQLQSFPPEGEGLGSSTKETWRLCGIRKSSKSSIKNKSVTRGFEFTLTIVGESGLGKSKLITSLFLTCLYSPEYSGLSHRIKKIVQVEQYSFNQRSCCSQQLILKIQRCSG